MPRVLIADDEDSMRSLVARAIAMDGHDTVTAQDGAEALEILIREDGAFDLLLTDIQMPVMDGIALALAAAVFGGRYPDCGGGGAGRGEDGLAERVDVAAFPNRHTPRKRRESGVSSIPREPSWIERPRRTGSPAFAGDDS
jgi:hypothetical protein